MLSSCVMTFAFFDREASLITVLETSPIFPLVVSGKSYSDSFLGMTSLEALIPIFLLG